MTFRAVIIGGDAAGMSAATRIRSARPDGEVVVLERSRFTSYSACGIPFLVGGLVGGGVDALVADAHTTEDQSAWGAPPPDQVIAHTNLYWRFQAAPGRTAGTVETGDVQLTSTS